MEEFAVEIAMRIVHSLASNAAVSTVIGILYALPFVSSSDSLGDGPPPTFSVPGISGVTSVLNLSGPDASTTASISNFPSVPPLSPSLAHSVPSNLTESGNGVSSSSSVTLQSRLPSQTTSLVFVTVDGLCNLHSKGCIAILRVMTTIKSSVFSFHLSEALPCALQ